MKRGKHVCETLKAIRSKIAEENEIDYTPIECHHEGDCAGTCPACEREVRWLESMLRRRRALGKAVTIAGLSVALGSVVSSCQVVQPNGYMEDPHAYENSDSLNKDSVEIGKYVVNEDSSDVNILNKPEGTPKKCDKPADRQQ